MALKSYKAVTSGQSLDDAATVTFDWQGGTLKPLRPANLRSTRDADGNYLIEWTGRSRVGGGMIPGSDVPLAEEEEAYDVEFLDVSDNVLRTVRVVPERSDPAILLPVDPVLDPPFLSNNNLLDPGNTHVLTYTQQTLGHGSWMEARLNANPNDVAAMGLVPPEAARYLRQRGVGWPTGVFYSEVQFGDSNAVSTTNKFVVYFGAGGPGYPPQVFDSGSLGTADAARIRIEVGDKLRFYWDYTGSGSVPFYESDTEPPTPLVGQLSCTTIDDEGCSITDVRIGRTFRPSVVYTTVQQTADSNDAVFVQVFQVSSLVGRGAAARITL